MLLAIHCLGEISYCLGMKGMASVAPDLTAVLLTSAAPSCVELPSVPPTPLPP